MDKPNVQTYLDMRNAFASLATAHAAVREVVAAHAGQHEATLQERRKKVEVDDAIKRGASNQSGKV
jgi:hypothetical protein